MNDRTKVILPKMLWNQAKDKQELKLLISAYMRRYPGYRVVEIGKYYATCEVGR